MRSNKFPVNPGIPADVILKEVFKLDSHKIYLGNLDHSVSEEDIVEIFSRHGEIESVMIKAGDGFGFIRFRTLEGAQKAIDAMNGKEFHGRTLKVEDARPVTHHVSRFRK